MADDYAKIGWETIQKRSKKASQRIAELVGFLQLERLDRFRKFYSSRGEGSYLLDAMSVEEQYRGVGIGKALLEETRVKASNDGYALKKRTNLT